MSFSADTDRSEFSSFGKARESRGATPHNEEQHRQRRKGAHNSPEVWLAMGHAIGD